MITLHIRATFNRAAWIWRLVDLGGGQVDDWLVTSEPGAFLKAVLTSDPRQP